MYHLPNILAREIEDFRERIEEFEQGKLDPTKFKSIRVPQGIYEQRGNDIFMARIRCASGFVTPAQLRAVGEVTKNHAGLVHITTRQELQIHDIPVGGIYHIVKGLYDAGLGTRGSGGNTIRNIMASEETGVSPNDAFDVAPYVTALTDKLIREQDSWELPRKVKISFSSSDADTSMAVFNDIGFIAKLKDGQRGFKVILGGGAGSKPQVGYTLFDFAPEEELFSIVDAIKKMFNKYGNRRNKHKARMRFLFYKYGADNVVEFFHEFYRETRKLEKNKFALPQLSFEKRTPSFAPAAIDTAEYAVWKSENVFSQSQAGLFQVFVPFHHGNLTPAVTIELANFIENFGDDVIRCTIRQNFMLRNIPGEYLGNVYLKLQELGVETANPYFVNQLVSCTGADTCKLGICLSKGALNAIKGDLLERPVDFSSLKGLRVNISGCPNSCGQQMMADFGFFGKAGRNERMYPAYNVVAGARIGGENPRLAEKVAEVNAKDIAKFTHEVLEHYTSVKSKYLSFADYFDGEGKAFIVEAAARYENVPTYAENPFYYTDWTAKTEFSVVGKEQPECSAGLFDIIEVEQRNIILANKELERNPGAATEPETLYQIALAASRMLLVTRAIEARTELEAFDSFQQSFINVGLVPRKYEPIVAAGRSRQLDVLVANADLTKELGLEVINLYKNMGDNLQFDIDTQAVQCESPLVEAFTQAANQASVARSKDFRGVQCPINFVKTKIELATLKSGDILEVLLDDGKPIQNVPGSCRLEGHEVLSETQLSEGHWSVLIKKK